MVQLYKMVNSMHKTPCISLSLIWPALGRDQVKPPLLTNLRIKHVVRLTKLWFRNDVLKNSELHNVSIIAFSFRYLLKMNQCLIFAIQIVISKNFSGWLRRWVLMSHLAGTTLPAIHKRQMFTDISSRWNVTALCKISSSYIMCKLFFKKG